MLWKRGEIFYLLLTSMLEQGPDFHLEISGCFEISGYSIKRELTVFILGTLIYHYDDSISLHRSILSRRQQREDLEPALYLPWIWPVTIMSTSVRQTILTTPNASV